MTENCERCGAEFEQSATKPRRTCSDACRAALSRRRRADLKARREAREPRPARGYSWPPAEAGNTLAVTHGARSPRLIAERAERIRADVLAHAATLGPTAEFIGHPMFAEAFERYCREGAIASLLGEWAWAVVEGSTEARATRRGGPTTGVQAVPAYIWTEIGRHESAAQKAASELGLDPTGFVRITKDGAISAAASRMVRDQRVAALVAQGQEIRRRREGE